MTRLADFRQIWLVDFEFSAPPGGIPSVVCMVAKEWRTGQVIRLWQDELVAYRRPPFSTGSDCLYVAFYASAEFSCHLALRWPLPANVLDLYAENRTLTNGLRLLRGNGLLGVLFHHGISDASHEEKSDMRDLAIRGGPWSSAERQSLLDYCESDVFALEKLLHRLVPKLDLPRALLRGRYVKAVAAIEANGIPIDVNWHDRLVENADAIHASLIRDLDSQYGVYENGSFRRVLFEELLARHRIEWPMLASGALNLQAKTFSTMALRYPFLKKLKTLRCHLSQLQLSPLPIGPDGRNRCLLSPFSSKTGRNQPSSSNFIFGRAKWFRRLVRPKPGYALLYVDYAQQEFGIAAALSKDDAMQKAYYAEDPYLSFAIQAGAAPQGATKATHGDVRNCFKQCTLATQYGMGAQSLALRIGKSPLEAQSLLDTHRRLYERYWAWSEGAVSYASLFGKIETVFGWRLLTTPTTTPRTIQNFPMQANGAEILRVACCYLTEAGIRVAAPVHDAVLVECPIEDIDTTISEVQFMLAQASRVVLGGFTLKTDITTTKYPAVLSDSDSSEIWATIRRVLSH